MNIATSGANAPLASGKAETAAARPSPNTDDHDDGQAFGHVLAQQMEGHHATDASRPDDAVKKPAGDPDETDEGSVQPVATNAPPSPETLTPVSGFGVVVPEDQYPTAGPTSTDSAARAADAAGTDLAAQIALVSQWGGAARPDASSGAPGAKAADRTTRVASATIPVAGAVDKAVGAKAASTADDRLSLIDAIVGRLEGAASHAPSDASSITSSFATSVAAAVTAQVAGAQQSAATTTPLASAFGLHEQVGTTAWSNEVGQAALRLAANDLQSASLRVNPEHLGPLDVQVRIDNGTAHLLFSAAHVETRQAIEASRPTLDHLFAEQGLKIGDCNVDDPSQRRGFDADAARRDGSAGRWGADGSAVDPDLATPVAATGVIRPLGLVDTFA